MRRGWRELLGGAACMVSLMVGCAVMTELGGDYSHWLKYGSLSFPWVILVFPWLSIVTTALLWAFSLGGSEHLGVPLISLIAPSISLLLCGFAGGIIGGRLRHPVRGFLAGVCVGVVLGAILMGTMWAEMDV